MKIVTRLYLLFFLSAISTPLSIFGQSDTSGIINTYHKVIEIIPSKACISVQNINLINMNSMVMIIQMKGATINTNNTPSFGYTLSLNNTGNYEIGTVCFIDGDSVFLFHELLN